jgi:hypothetical protein
MNQRVVTEADFARDRLHQRHEIVPCRCRTSALTMVLVNAGKMVFSVELGQTASIHVLLPPFNRLTNLLTKPGSMMVVGPRY